MKRGMVALLTVAMTAVIAAGCGKSTSGQGSTGMEGPINLISREDGSGTRGAFIELFGIEEKDASGEKVDMTYEEAQITNNTSVMMTTVAGDTSTIGYISLGSLNDTVKALKIDGAEASGENVKDGSYKISRKFNIITNEDMSLAAKEFIDFILSSDGQAIVEAEGYIPLEGTNPYEGSNPKGKVVVAGSSSVTPVMEKLAEAYKKANGNAEIEVQQSDSTTGITSARDGLCDIGMASRELKESETSYGLTSTVIATDGIAVIVNKDNPIDELSSDQVKGIYTGDITEWSEVAK
ncbi:MAG TPA: substrate-binding domain-containing protein [Candidatus Pelethocola excrementipullorum]|nr:substrate-binding domain-containing protein [Candidatus Pelethocola excrementipullorum]